jgi:tetratricopeptide (TPR) repeat protein
LGRARHNVRDSIDDFDPNELIGNMAHGSPTPQRPPRPPNYSEGFEIDFDSQHGGQSTRQVPPEQIEALANMSDEYDDDDPALIESVPPRPADQWNEAVGSFGARRYQSQPSPEDAIEAELDDAALGEDIDEGVAQELGHAGQVDDEDMPFDPHAARAFDAGMQGKEGGPTEAVFVSGFDETDLPSATQTAGYEEGLSVAGSYDPYQHAHADPTVMNAEIVDTKRAASLVEDDLDEVDFYAGQGMFPEAMDALRILLARHPNHPLIIAKVREVQGLEAGELPLEVETPPAGMAPGIAMPVEITPDHTGGTDALDLDEIEEVSADDLEEVDGERPVKRKPTVMLEKPVDEGDADTHYDLGLAYKEMGLYDEAIKAFEKVLRAPGREVQCRVMLGMCQREQGNPQEAIHQFKQGLHANPHDRERLSLYYEIGITYESIGDAGEALYYFEAVTKRDPGFADANQRAEALRAGGGVSQQPPDDDL